MLTFSSSRSYQGVRGRYSSAKVIAYQSEEESRLVSLKRGLGIDRLSSLSRYILCRKDGCCAQLLDELEENSQ